MTGQDVRADFIRIPLPQGRSLAARLWKPAAPTPVPAILEFRPYRGWDLFRPLEDQYLPAWAEAGYAVLAVDIAGSGQSTGLLHDEYLPREIEDAIAAIEWCAGQPWCDGQAGLSGMSWSAFTALRVSGRRPAALKALALGGVSEDGWRTDIHNLGGALYAARVDWAGVMLNLNALPPDPAEFGEGWKAEWLARLAANRPWIEPWLAHPARDAYWADKAFDVAASPELPLLLYAGWADKYATSVLRIAEGWRGPVKTVIGPWEHSVPDLARRKPRIDFLGEALRWWDFWLKGIETGVAAEPPLRAWIGEPDRQGLMATGRWVGTNLPASGTDSLALGLTKTGCLGAIDEHGRAEDSLDLAPKPITPPALGVDRYEDTPGPFDLALAAQAGAVIVTTDPMAEDADILGSPALHCRARSDQAGGLIVARLMDIDPDGAAVRMTTGALNLAFRESWAEPRTPVPGEWMDVAVELQATAWRLKRGHRLALVLSADGWPTLWPDTAAARIESEAGSLILRLPLAEEKGGPAPAFAAPNRTRRAETGPLQWIDPEQEALPPSDLAGAAAYDSQSAGHHLPATETDYFSASRFELALTDDGRQALASKVSRTAFKRPGWSVRMETRLVAASTPEAFEIRWTIRAEHDGEVVFDHSGGSEIARSVV
jgi:hypothetical protein